MNVKNNERSMASPWGQHIGCQLPCLGEIYGMRSHKKPWNHRMNDVKHLRWEWRWYQLPCLGEIYGVRSHKNTWNHRMNNVNHPRWAWQVRGVNMWQLACLGATYGLRWSLSESTIFWRVLLVNGTIGKKVRRCNWSTCKESPTS